jgi:hypothetical protein
LKSKRFGLLIRTTTTKRLAILTLENPSLPLQMNFHHLNGSIIPHRIDIVVGDRVSTGRWDSAMRSCNALNLLVVDGISVDNNTVSRESSSG